MWTPHDGQLPIVSAFFIDWVVGVFTRCGRKFGKTELAIYCMIMFAKLFENAECYYVADEKDHARAILWDNGRLPCFFTTIRQLPDEADDLFLGRKKAGIQLEKEWITHINNSEMTVRLGRSIIRVDGAKNFSKADGLSPTFVVYDEFKDHDSRYDQRMRPNLMALNGRILIIGTPPDNTENYYCKTEKEFQTKRGHVYFKKPCYENPIVYPGGKDNPMLMEEEKAYKLRGEWHVFAREYLADIVPDQNARIFPMFFRREHVRPYSEMIAELKRNYKKWDFFISYDPASTTVFGVLLVAIHIHDKRVWLLDEIYEDKQMETTSKKIYTRAQLKRRAIYEYDADWYQLYDYAAAWFQTEVAVEFDEAIHPCTKDLKDKEAKLSVIKDTMLHNRFTISDACPKTIWEIENYKKDDKGRIPKENDHNIDNLRYILNAACYASVPRNEIKPDDLDNRRYYTPEHDLQRNAYNELLMGGIDECEYDDIVLGD